jgi:hypothetical protein
MRKSTSWSSRLLYLFNPHRPLNHPRGQFSPRNVFRITTWWSNKIKFMWFGDQYSDELTEIKIMQCSAVQCSACDSYVIRPTPTRCITCLDEWWAPSFSTTLTNRNVCPLRAAQLTWQLWNKTNTPLVLTLYGSSPVLLAPNQSSC